MHICQFLGIGGLEKVLYLLIHEQLNAGHKVTLIVYDWEKTWVKRFKKSGINIIDSYQKKSGYDFSLLRFLNQNINKQYDIIHTHDLNPALYIAPLKLYNKLIFNYFPKFIHTTHGMEHIDQSPKTRLYEKFISIFIDKLVAVSPKFKTYYLEKTYIKSKNIHNIDNGTPVANNLPTSNEKINAKKNLIKTFNLDENKLIFTYVARLVPLKGQDFLLKEFKRLDQYQLLLVGPAGNKEYWQYCSNICPENSYMVGSQENINEILLGSDYYISASHHEGIPISVLEAGAIGLPCILTDIPGHKTLQPNDTKVATFFDINNSKELEKSICEAIENQKEISNNIHEIVLKNYSSKKMFNEYDKVYREK